MTPGSTHRRALPLLSGLRGIPTRSLPTAMEAMDDALRHSGLQMDIHTVIVFEGSGRTIELVGATSFGEAVLMDMKSSSGFYPCPEGECEAEATELCMWCGRAV